MSKRRTIAKSVRFEVFKRDSFTCQYCGEKAPDVVLHVDHIHPVAEGGTNDILNLITSCRDCNGGKSDKLLSDKSAIQKQRNQLDELNERRNQLEMMAQWRAGLRDIEAGFVSEVCGHIADTTDGNPNESGQKLVRSWLKKYTAKQLIEAADKSFSTYGRLGDDGAMTDESWERAFKKIPLIAKVVSGGGYSDELLAGFYVAAILANRCIINDWDKPVTAKILELCFRHGADIEAAKAHAKKTVDAETFWFKIVPMPHKSPGFKEDFEKLRKAAS